MKAEGFPAIVVCVFLSLVFLSTSYAVEINDVNIYQMDFYCVYDGNGTLTNGVEDTNWGDFRVTLTSDSDPCDYYVNLMIRRSGYGEHWVIRNMMIPNSNQISGSTSISRFFDLGFVGISNGDELSTLEYSVIKELDYLEVPPSPNDWQGITVEDGFYNAFGMNDANGTLAEPNDPGPPPVPDVVSGYMMLHDDGGGAGSTRKSKHYDNVPDVEEPTNGCGPGSVRRGLGMLENNDDIEVEDMDETMGKFKKASGWSENSGIKGVKKFLKGKAAIAYDAEPNIVTKYQQIKKAKGKADGNVRVGNGIALDMGGPPSFEFIKQEIDANEAVEIICYPDGGGMGHAVTATGYSDDGKEKQITVKDDPVRGEAPGEETGNEERNSRFSNGDNPTLDDLAEDNIHAIISQSPYGAAAICVATEEEDKTRPWTVSGEWEDAPPPGTSVVVKGRKTVNFQVRPGKTIVFYWTADGLKHPLYKTFKKKNESGKNMNVKLKIPKDPSITDWVCKITGKRRRTGKINVASFIINGGDEGIVSFGSFGLVNIKPHRIAGLATESNDVNLYCAVNLETYMNENPTGFIGTEPLEPNATLADFGVEIINGRVADINGILWSTEPFIFDANVLDGWSVEDSNHLLDSNDFQAQFGTIYVEDSVDYYPLGDFDEDFDVDVADLNDLVIEWLNTDCEPPLWCDWTDIDFSGTVEAKDFAEFANHWFEVLE